MRAPMTAAALKRGAINGSFCILGLASLLGALAFIVSQVSGLPFVAALILPIPYLFIGAVVITFIYYFNGRARAGKILIHCGRNPMSWLLLICAAGLIIPTLQGESIFRSLGISGPVGILLNCAFIGFMTVLGLGRLAVAENGIWAYISLIEWQSIQSYYWNESKTPTLMLKLSAAPLTFSKCAIPIAPEKKTAVDELLKQHCAQPGVPHTS